MRSLALLLLVLGLSCGMQVAAQETPKRALPPLTADLNSLSYPSSALRANLQGRVLVRFTISKKGVVDDVEVVNGDPPGEFDATAIKAVKQVRFTVPGDWQASGGAAYHFQLSVLFKLNPCVAPACVAPKMHEAADDFLVVGAQAK